MKKLIFTPIISFFTFFTVSAQIIVPPELEFKGLQENWSYISKDTNFIKSPIDLWSTPYWGHYPIDATLYKDFVFILENVMAQSPYDVVDGCLLHALDVNTGEPKWIFHNNSYVGLKHREDYMHSFIHIDEDKNVEITGFKAIDTLDKTQLALGFYGNPIVKTIDFESGQLIKEKQGHQSEKTYYNGIGLGTTILLKDVNNQLMFGRYEQTFDSIRLPTLHYVFYRIDDNLEIDTEKVFSYAYGIDASLDIYPNYNRRLSFLIRDTMVFLFEYSNFNTHELKESKLVWIYIGDINNIHVVKELEITHLIEDYKSDKTGTYIETANGTIVLHEYIKPEKPIKEVNANNFTWVTWLDKDGQLLAQVPYIFNEKLGYIRIRTLGVYDGKLIMAMSRQNGVNGMGMDILEIDRDANTAKVIGSIVTPFSQEFKIGDFSVAQLLPDGNILIGIPMDYKFDINESPTQIFYYYSFKLKDLGITINTEDVAAKEQFTIYPNPTSNILNIASPQSFDQVRIWG